MDFYLLGNVGQTGKFTYACRIAWKAFSRGLKVYLQTQSSEHSRQLDAMLWTFSQASFIPHAIANNVAENWENFPVQLGQTPDSDNGPHADLLISLTRDAPVAHAGYKRIADLIIDDPDEKQSGRERFRYYREQGIAPNTHHIG